MKYFFLCCWTMTLIGLTTSTASADFSAPSLKRPVVDRASMLNRRTESLINRALSYLNKTTGTQLAVLTVPSLEGLSIEQGSIQVVDQWKLGKSHQDRGLLLLIARKEKRIRIEVGQGLEGALTDAHAKRIIRETMAPLIRAGDVSGAILAGLYQIVQKTNPEVDAKKIFSLSPQYRYRTSRQPREFTFGDLIKIILIILALLFIGPKNLFLLLLFSSGRSSGGGHFGRGSFGGYSGGGGGFSGGGASGGW